MMRVCAEADMKHAEYGQAILEYVLVITVIVAAIIAGVSQIRSGVDAAMSKAGTTIAESVDRLP
jgi:Flp pilus assembly pilin Flp